MSKPTTILKCKTCGNIVEVICQDPAEEKCCDSNLDVFEEKTTGEGEPKHKPVVTRIDNAYNVKVGEVEHPMDEDHYIAMIEILADGQSHKQYLNPGDKPEATFEIPEADEIVVREFCTKHGLWRT
jgi:superoxide reductase